MANIIEFERRMEDKLNRECVPYHIRHGIVEYIMRGQPLGDFLYAVFTNNLKDSFAKADDTNVTCMVNTVRFMYQWAPAPCQGSEDEVHEWVAIGGLEGDDEN